MKILLYGINYSPELTGIGKYSGEMARWLAAQGHEVRVVTAPPYYPDWKVWQGFSSWRFSKRQEAGVTVIRCPVYVPSRPTAIKRLLHLASFSLSSAFAVFAQLRWKPDLVILVVPTLFCAPQAIALAKLTGAKSVLHIQDYEVDALFGLSIVKGAKLKRFAFATEQAVLRAFDRVSTISSGMLQRAAQKGVAPEKLRFFPNWSETARFQNVPRDAELLIRLGVDPGKRVLLYSGNIGEKQGLECVIDAAEQLAERTELVFLVVGEGAGKARLLDMSLQRRLSNVVFAPLQPYEDLPALLASADCHLVIQKRGAADAVLPSKLTNILAVGGNALITADPETSLGLLCSEYPGIATLVEPESVDALIMGIKAVLAMPAPNVIATRYAREFLDKDHILTRFLAEIYIMGLNNDLFRTVVASTPLISIDLVVQNSHGEILLGQRVNRPAQGVWFVPGGRILKNETMDAAFSRLTRDELGKAFQRSEARMLGAYEHFYADSVFGDSSDSPDTHYVVLAYQLVLAEGEGLQPPHAQHDSYRWWPLTEAQASEEVHDNTRAYLE